MGFVLYFAIRLRRHIVLILVYILLQRTFNNYALRSKVKDIFEYAHHAEYWESIMTTYENNSQNKSVYTS